MMKRTFIAVGVKPTAKLKEDYDLVRYRLRLERINWISVDHLHITLNFLGDTDDQLIPEIVRYQEKVVSATPAFQLTLRSLGVFKSLQEPRVLWMGCDPCPGLGKIKSELDRDLSGLGFKPEGREFSPHLTLGRVKEIRQINQLAQLITLYKNVEVQTQTVENITFFESRLTPSGPEYLPIQVFSLQGK